MSLPRNTPVAFEAAYAAERNTSYRKILHTTDQMQVVLMSIPPGGAIPAEVHEQSTQMTTVVEGTARVILDELRSDILHPGASVLIPAGIEHEIRNVGSVDLRLYNIYSPPVHEE